MTREVETSGTMGLPQIAQNLSSSLALVPHFQQYGKPLQLCVVFLRDKWFISFYDVGLIFGALPWWCTILNMPSAKGIRLYVGQYSPRDLCKAQAYS